MASGKVQTNGNFYAESHNVTYWLGSGGSGNYTINFDKTYKTYAVSVSRIYTNSSWTYDYQRDSFVWLVSHTNSSATIRCWNANGLGGYFSACVAVSGTI